MRLIDADALKDMCVYASPCTSWEQESKLIDLIDAQPTIDAVPVVRCKDCKWYGIYEGKQDGTPDKRHKPSVCLMGPYAKRRDQDWFCADAERREG